MLTLTVETYEEHIIDKCPICSSKNTSLNNYLCVKTNTVYGYCKCEDCKYEYTNIFKLVKQLPKLV